MINRLEDYATIIKALPTKDKYTKEDLLIPELRINQENTIEVYYAPHNEYINTKAHIVIVGITPGFEQMRTAITTAREGLLLGKPMDVIQYECKVAARFSGSLRKNMISMLDTLAFNKACHLSSSQALFEEEDRYLHTVSLVPYPVFVKGKNYTGHTPKLIKSSFLMGYVNQVFTQQIEKLECKNQILYIPLGKAVEEVLILLSQKGLLKEKQILKGFPHPSGANVNRLKQLEANKRSMEKIIKDWE